MRIGGMISRRKAIEGIGATLLTSACQDVEVQIALGSKMLPPAQRNLVVKAGEMSRQAVFEGHPLEVQLR